MGLYFTVNDSAGIIKVGTMFGVCGFIYKYLFVEIIYP